MTDAAKKKRILAQPCKVKCQGCGKEIDPEGALTNIEYVKTKRGSEWFIHTWCRDSVWEGKIV